MATGDVPDFIARLKSYMPDGWFPATGNTPGQASPTPVLDSIMAGFAWSWSWIYGLLAYARLQTRIGTATDSWLDAIGNDFFGPYAVNRTPNQPDASYRALIEQSLLPERDTRNGMITALTNLTGQPPVIFEPSRPADTGGWTTGRLGWTTGPGAWGSLLLPSQVFITVHRPYNNGGIANVCGWGTLTNPGIGGGGGWSTTNPAMGWSNLSQVTTLVTDAQIYATVAATKPAGVIAWVQILGPIGRIINNMFVPGLAIEDETASYTLTDETGSYVIVAESGT